MPINKRPKLRGGAPRGNQNALKHGRYAMKRALKQLGSRAIDKRTSVGRALNGWRRELIADLGGLDALSTQQLTAIDLCVRTRFILDSVDGWIFQQPSVLNARKKKLHPIILERQQLTDSLMRTLKDLGLKRQSKPVLSLDEYIASRGNGEGER